ncbi:hypothetical protein N7468_008076 [Penicillium chermesinum]|uniref:Uncharacterized protein n=1 Tax=Penicillium chermesinum TaxID=63820 RepID=A0A9W9TIB6_9EURO|nr:uncharacterized protein N7468_008076 [Penicillium chermesinum]KAJ5223534.1 hypothetical protein N7468_008076 [Penicillium chermesinum]KAJ6155635.1 hypothetical protein N7470_006201 [Penicillium chermesinum]
MVWTVCNTTEEKEKISEADLWDGGITFHEMALIVGGVCGVLACAVSLFLIVGHATHYSKPVQQRHIIRILWMVPIYSVVAWLSILFYHDAVYFEVLGDCYEAFAIASFFSLMCSYIAPDLHSQKDYFRGVTPKSWVWPLPWFQKWKCCFGHRGAWRNPRSGLTWFNVVWAGIFQYCAMRVLMTIVAVATQATGRYCEESLSPAFAHIWVLAIESASVTVAMYCLIQFYIQIKDDIAEHRPFMKVLSIKLVIFLSFWQTTLISLLVSGGAIKATDKMAMNDLKYGIGELLLNIEMFIFSIMHLWAFPWRPYVISSSESEVTDFYGAGKSSYEGGKWGVRALVDAMNPLDLFKAIGRSVRWVFVGRKRRTEDISYRQHNETIGLQTSGVDGTAYQGPAGSMSGGRYGMAPDEEDAILLANAQSNPEASHLGTSPYGEEDDYLHGGGRYYPPHSQPSYYDPTPPHITPYEPHDAIHNPYPTGPLTEQVPMPIPEPSMPVPDPYQPPPPYPESFHRP